MQCNSSSELAGSCSAAWIGAEFSHRRLQGLILAFQRRDLAGIMFVDHFLDRGGAGEGGLFTHQRRGRAQGKARDRPCSLTQ